MLTLKEIQSVVDEKIRELSFIKEPTLLYEPFNYVLNNGGKRIRPALTLLACSMFDNDISKAIAPAIGLELFHNFTLLHDDIMDNADVRRNQPTVHKKWNKNVAILSGDAMLIKAYEFIAKIEKDKFPDVFSVFNQTALEVCEGQQYDMDFENRYDVDEEEYLEMIRLKTSVLLACCLKIGAIIGGAGSSDQNLLYDFGIKIGLGFQLKDDYLDSFGDIKTFGKKIGGDILANKKTYLLIKALKSGEKEISGELKEIIMENKYSGNDKIENILAIYEKLEMRCVTEEKIQHYYNEAISVLERMSIDKRKVLELKRFAEKLIVRDK